ncbi:ABC transporter ATP-binding protein [Streptomyces oryzae]|uniref:ABC transporter ATP-binding protein n=1 Tax=Streptomyces oryzae TaxID=1434886 RepID=A0ABS3X940_9ACTN|nr:ABC transporter ATP-binding protein [Streptomyces oryzae]MBO8191601.1 ABC transporter ATP-binding protein [Streptomyces oryzae]
MPVIEVSDLRKSYGDKKAVDGVSFGVEDGEIFGILGPNGAGKTTTVECVEGLRRPDGGSVRVAGYDPVADRDAVTRILGAQLQESELQPKITAGEALELYAACYPDPADWRDLAERLGLTEKLGTRFAKLSGGQKQRLSIALALVGNPRIVVLDELTTGLDPRARRDTWRIVEDIRDRGVTVLLVTHFMEEAQHLCDRIALIDQGRITALDTPAGLIGRTASSTAISFMPSVPLETRLLADLPAVGSVAEQDGRIVAHGTDETVHALLSLLTGQGVTAHQLRITEASLDDAYLDLTGTDR